MIKIDMPGRRDSAGVLRAGEPVEAIEVAEEIEQMGKSDARELDSRITQVLGIG